MADWQNWLALANAQMAVPPTMMPQEGEGLKAAEAGAFYGMPNEGLYMKGAKVPNTENQKSTRTGLDAYGYIVNQYEEGKISSKQAKSAVKELNDAFNDKSSVELRDYMAANQLLVNRSALAALGYEPRETLWPGANLLDGNTAGQTLPASATGPGFSSGPFRKDMFQPWDQKGYEDYNSTPAHEALHAGLGQLYQEDPEDPDVLRALEGEQHAYGEIIMREQMGLPGYTNAKDLRSTLSVKELRDMIEKLEKKAAKLIAKRRTRGPK